jgi:hypothetical protein
MRHRCAAGQHAAVFDAVVAGEHQGDRLGVDAVLFRQYARRERLFGIARLDGHDSLGHDRAGIERFVHEMHGATAELHAIFERLALCLEAREGRQQRGMNVQDAAAKGGDEIGRKQAHEPRQANQIGAGIVERGNQHAVVGLALEPFRGDDARGYAPLGGAVEARSALAVADHQGDAGIGDAADSDAVRQSREIRAAAAEQHANLLRHKREKLAYPGRGAKRQEDSR